jgi:tRNA 2-thiouridine synthesizing protein B
MSTLFTINKAPSHALLQASMRMISKGDGILFLEDGVYHAMDEQVLASVPEQVRLFCLKEDLQARGLQAKLAASAESVNYRKFVGLCTEYDKVVSWF